MLVPVLFPTSPSASSATIPPRPRRHRHHPTTPFPSISSHSRSLRHHHHRLTPLLASSRGDRGQPVGGTDMGLFTVTKKATTPFEGQKPGTSGLRKKVSLHPPLLLAPRSGCLCDVCWASWWLRRLGSTAAPSRRGSLQAPAGTGSRGSVRSVVWVGSDRNGGCDQREFVWLRLGVAAVGSVWPFLLAVCPLATDP
jgi:hypothetical protein